MGTLKNLLSLIPLVNKIIDGIASIGKRIKRWNIRRKKAKIDKASTPSELTKL